jgi:hypothetical protein
VIIADADKAGHDNARRAYSVLKGTLPVRIYECTRGKDITAHLENGGSLGKGQFKDLTAALSAVTSPNGARGEVGASRGVRDASRLAQVALDRLQEAADGAQHAGRSLTAWWFAQQLRGVPREVAEEAMRIYVQNCPQVNSEGETTPFTLERAMASLDSAFDNPAPEGWEPGPLVAMLNGEQSDAEQFAVMLAAKALTTEQVKELKPSPPLVGGYLYRNSLARIYGPPGSSKTFLMLDWSLSVAALPDSGWWHGTSVPMIGGPVINVVAEGAFGLGRRVAAFESCYGTESYAHPLYCLPLAVNLFNRQEVDGFVRYVEPIQPVLITFDTLARCSLGADENSTRDAGVVIAHMDMIRRATAACVVLIHHTGYDEKATLVEPLRI